MRPKRFLSLPVLAVLLLMMFVYYTTIFVFIDGSFDLQSSNGTFNAAIFTILASFSVFSFFVCVLSDPGHVPSSYVPDVEGQGSAKDNAERKKCDKCYGYKPPRTHHCRVCKKCVLKMDHHCLWINNCVGYWNYKAFFVFTSYATLASIHSMILFICSVFLMDIGSSSKMFYPVWISVAFVACVTRYVFFGRNCGVCSEVMYGTMAIGLTTTLLTLFGWHVYLTLHNMTTIEYYEGKRAKWLAMKSGQSYRHPFNISPYKNITSVLGPNILKWLCPTAVSHLKEGVSFPTLRDNS